MSELVEERQSVKYYYYGIRELGIMSSYIGYRQRMEIFLEKALPYLVAGLAIAMVFVVPLTFSAFHTINTKSAKNVLSGESIERLEDSIMNKLNNLKKKVLEMEHNPKIGPRGLPGEPGEKGRDGIVGLPGASGRKGDVGSPGEKGEKGDTGPIGPTGAIGPKGNTGEGSGEAIPGPQGPPGPIGVTGPKGQKGDMGVPGMKGNSGAEPSPPIIKMINALSKGNMKKYKIDCIGTCFIQVEMKVETGDADLYAKEESVPVIQNSNCDDCPLCKSRSSSLKDSCPNIQTHLSDHFYLAVVAHKGFKNGQLKLWGFNLANVTALGN